jgi:hypothetical protein
MPTRKLLKPLTPYWLYPVLMVPPDWVTVARPPPAPN